ncbi:tannase and feruloyl esterase-domain-containing protein [Auriculariales sp. MPI-PUGE-AT-0066]|nr:tannase and feruloyl esterase-domain-containing protein [Auriculariales sp. MPI-PUGE-AT-0066]
MVDLTTVSARLLSAQSRCFALSSTFSTPGLATIETHYVTGGTNLPLPDVSADCVSQFGMAGPEVSVPQNVCYASLAINTSSTSTTRVNVWLPDDYNGRFYGTGTGGLSGCFDWPTLSYGTSLNFATAATDVGHTGITAEPFLNAPEVLRDFAWRSIHVEAVVSKQIIKAYYGTRPSYSYFGGCSMGGRQGFQAAEVTLPEDFDGIIACAPGLNPANLFGWHAFISKPFMATEPGAMSTEDWTLVRNETMKQCDHLDGAVDGTISYPEDCKFDPRALLCSDTRPQDCLNTANDMFEPDGQFFYPHYNPGGELSNPAGFALVSGASVPLPFLTHQMWRYVVAGKLSEMKAWTGDLRAFKKRGGKLVNIHGSEDTLLPSGVSSHQYAMTADVTGKRDMDNWYALYLVPGHNHCINTGSVAKGAWKFGQLGQIPEPRAASNTSEHNILLALPKKLVGMTDEGETREVCRYPSRGKWVGGVWKCGSRNA